MMRIFIFYVSLSMEAEFKLSKQIGLCMCVAGYEAKEKYVVI